MTRTEGISVRAIRMLSQLVSFGPVEQLNVKFNKNCMLLMKLLRASGKLSTWFPLGGHVQKARRSIFVSIFEFSKIFIFRVSNSYFLKNFPQIADLRFRIIFVSH